MKTCSASAMSPYSRRSSSRAKTCGRGAPVSASVLAAASLQSSHEGGAGGARAVAFHSYLEAVSVKLFNERLVDLERRLAASESDPLQHEAAFFKESEHFGIGVSLF